MKKNFRTFLGNAFINILSEENVAGYAHGRITEDFLKAHVPVFNKPVYLCGPPPMMDAIQIQLADLGMTNNLLVVEI